MVTMVFRMRYSDYKIIRSIFPSEYDETTAHYFMRLRKFLQKKSQEDEGWGRKQGE